MTEQEIRDLFKSKNVPLDRDDVWSVQAARVVKHKALERLAAQLNISYDAPQILRNERDEAVILVTGRLGDRSEWSIGEALTTDGTRPGNYKVVGKQAPYVYAMAEKRAKDRVILKLAGLHGAYSEDEADDFKQPAPRQEAANSVEVDTTSDRTLANALKSTLAKAKTTADLAKWFADNQSAVEGLPESLTDEVRSAYAARLHELKRAA
jgi:murein DD-endopeptidase MepM/ murein hydrolase activator NlpD